MVSECEILCDDGSIFWEFSGEYFCATVMPAEKLVLIRIGQHESAIEVPIDRIAEVIADLKKVLEAAG